MKYLLYRPRTETLDELTAAILAQLRDRKLSSKIFDYGSGLALYQDLIASGSTVASVHRYMFDKTPPFSWFVALQLAPDRGLSNLPLLEGPDAAPEADLVRRLASGDREAARDVVERTGGRNAAIRVLPAHTLKITIEAGGKADPERRRVYLDE
ncbi:hypothetical protein [Catellatospora tritici]|uniref:hypothetical protein n=1 Tax=Catellatospora tritici TaxID=2851566 RepID=UPI001C2D5F39|nr:hypothetical protein [Catellatospora tritici]MBV1854401.1 hypothetical protein [Catellatospora tritici]